MIPLSLSGKTALVCGSTQGIGKAIATIYASAGATVILMARNASALGVVLDELPRPDEQDHAMVQADFSDISAVRSDLTVYMENH